MDEPVTSTSTNWALSAHLLGFLGTYIVPAFGNILAPMVIWLMKKEEDAFVARHALEVMNFQITVFLAMLVCAPLVLVFIGIPLLALLLVAQIVLGIAGTFAAAKGKEYQYPGTLRLVKG